MKRTSLIVSSLLPVLVLVLGYGIIRQFLPSPPSDPEMRFLWYLQRGHDQAAAENLSGAESSYRHAVALKPTDGEARSNLGDILQRRGRFQEAEGELYEALRLAPGSAIVHNSLGVFLQQQGQADKATAEFEYATTLDPQYDVGLVNLGLVSMEKDPRLALSYFARALRRKQYNSVTHANIAIVLRKLNRPETEVTAHTYMEHVSRGIELTGFRLPDEAVASYEQAIALNPDRSCAYVRLAFLHVLLGRHDDALAMYRRALNVDPTQAKVLREWIRYVEREKERPFPPTPQPDSFPDIDCERL